MRNARQAAPRPGPAGFSLLEVLLASATAVVILLGAYTVYESGQATYARTEQRTDIQQNARAALDTLVRQIRMAGYAALNSVQNPIVIGDANVLVIRGDVRLAGLPTPGVDTLFAVRTTANGDCPSPPCLMSQAPEASGVNVYAPNNATLPLAFGITAVTFAYFDGINQQLPAPLDGVAAGAYPDGAVIPNPLPAPTTQRDAVRRVQVTITAADPRTFAGPGGAGPQTYTLTEDVRIRNRN